MGSSIATHATYQGVRSLLDAVLEGARSGIAVLDADAHFLSVDPLFSDLSGYGRAEVRGRSLDSVVTVGGKPIPLAEGRAPPRGQEAEIRRRDGARIGVMLDIVAAEPTEGSAGFVVRLRPQRPDPTEPDRVVPGRARRREHQLRNALTVIAGNVDLIDRAVDDPALKHRLDLIQMAVEGAQDILNELAGG